MSSFPQESGRIRTRWWAGKQIARHAGAVHCYAVRCTEKAMLRGIVAHENWLFSNLFTNQSLTHSDRQGLCVRSCFSGTGLGLAAVYGTVTDHHGCISIFSEPGTGTVFKLYLPLSGDKRVDDSCAEELICGSDGILLVDDEEILRDVGKSLLEGLGYRVYLAEDGEHALEIYAREKEHISLVILDMLMPIMGGKETLLRLMERDPDIRVLILSGFNQEGTVDELEKLGARGFLQKPYLCQELSKAVAEALK